MTSSTVGKDDGALRAHNEKSDVTEGSGTKSEIGGLRWRLSRHCTCGRGENINYKDTVAKAGVTSVPCLSCEALAEIKRLDAQPGDTPSADGGDSLSTSSLPQIPSIDARVKELRDALIETQSLLALVYSIGAKPDDWRLEDIDTQLAEQMGSNRTLLSQGSPGQ